MSARARLSGVMGLALAACGNPAPTTQPAAAPPPAAPTSSVACGSIEPRYGVVACVDPLTPEEAAHRALHFMVATAGTIVVRVERRRGDGTPAETVTGGFAFDYRYVDGEVAERVARRIDGTIAQRTLLSGRGLRRALVDADGKPWLRGTTGHVATYELDARGWDAVERLWTGDGAPRADSTGVFMWRFVHDDAGHVTEAAAFAAGGAPMSTTDGWHLHRRTFGPSGCETKEAYYGLDGKPVAPAKGVAAYEYVCDRWGNRAQVRYVGLDGQNVAMEGEGWGFRWERDAHGTIVSQTPLDEAGAPRRSDGK